MNVYSLPALWLRNKMPNAEQILSGISQIVNDHWILAIYWHIYYGLLLFLLLSGFRITKDLVARLLSIPFFSVSALAFVIGNFVNGIFFSLLAVLLLWQANRFADGRMKLSSIQNLAFGLLLLLFGLFYPHFIKTDSFLTYLYSAPTGLIPCPTLAASLGITFMVNGFESRSFTSILASAGIVYAIIGTVYLHVFIDVVLLIGSLIGFYVGFSKAYLRIKKNEINLEGTVKI